MITMVKKKLLSGEPCAKCVQAEELLKRRGMWEQIDRVVWADEAQPQSEGWDLSRKHGVGLAPFFLVDRGGSTQVVTSVLTLIRDHLDAVPTIGDVATSALGQAAVEAASVELADAAPQRIVEFVLGSLGKSCALAFSGAEDVAVIDLAAKTGLPFSVFCLDTGRLHAETYRFLDVVRDHYGIEIEIMTPELLRLQEMTTRKGLFSFYRDGHSECCGIRKVEPLRRALRERAGWMTGQRRDQSPTRAAVPVLVWDTAHRPEGMLKANPLAQWSQTQVWDYIRQNGVPYNELHDHGYISIGCEPCTRQSRPGEHERAARWWWEESTQRECGLHIGASGKLERASAPYKAPVI